jgi:hypothetical protein
VQLYRRLTGGEAQGIVSLSSQEAQGPLGESRPLVVEEEALLHCCCLFVGPKRWPIEILHHNSSQNMHTHLYFFHLFVIWGGNAVEIGGNLSSQICSCDELEECSSVGRRYRMRHHLSRRRLTHKYVATEVGGA